MGFCGFRRFLAFLAFLWSDSSPQGGFEVPFLSVRAHDDARGATAALPCKALDTTAAGDTFAGYLAAALAAGNALAEAVALATAAAGLSVQKQGAQPSIPYHREVAMQLVTAP